MARDKPRKRKRLQKPPVCVEDVIGWAKAHFERTGRWPHAQTGTIPEAHGQTWASIDQALRVGSRGFPGGSSLSRLLNEHIGWEDRKSKRVLTLEQVLAWMQAYHNRTGEWPKIESGAVPEAPGETWYDVDVALRGGYRGLPAGLSLRRLRMRQGWK